MGINAGRVAVLAGFCIFLPVLDIRDPDWYLASGQEWEHFSPEARGAFLAGFLAGSATSQAVVAGARDSAGLWQAIDSLRKEGLLFPYAANVYGARIEDYFWWEDHRRLPIWYAYWEVNNDLKRLTQHGE
jgi:hypothetical protein